MRTTLLVLWAAWICAVQAPAAPRPNIIFILADDLGYTDLGCQGSKYYLSPNIDRLAQSGMRFTDGHTAGPNCQPTRAALMSGQYMPRTGVYTVGNIDRFNWQSRPLKPVENVTRLPLEKVILPQALKRAGYATAMFGKWHLGQEGEYHPARRGFDEAIVSEGQHFDFATEPPQDIPAGKYLADYLTDRAEKFIRSHKDQPFFLYLAHFAVHAPHQAKPELIRKFEQRSPSDGHKNPTYAAMVYSVDESVGRITALLRELGLTDNTLVIFSSDNGGVGGYQREGLGGGVTDNAPLRGGKGMLYEGGIRVPFIFSWPGKIAAGVVCPEPIITMDLYPTFLEIAGAKPPADQPLDGVSLWKLLSTGGKETLQRDAIFWHFPGYLGQGAAGWRTKPVGVVRSGGWKLIQNFEDKRLELYNLKNDLGETNNLAASNTTLTRDLEKKLAAWQAEIKAPMPTPNKDQTPPTESTKKKRKKRPA